MLVLEDCLEDTPAFRQRVGLLLDHLLQVVPVHLQGIVGGCRQMLEGCRVQAQALQTLSQALSSLAASLHGQDAAWIDVTAGSRSAEQLEELQQPQGSLAALGRFLSEAQRDHEQWVEGVEMAVISPLRTLLQEDLLPVGELVKQRDRFKHQWQGQLQRRLRGKAPSEGGGGGAGGEEPASVLAQAQRGYLQASLRLVAALNRAQLACDATLLPALLALLSSLTRLHARQLERLQALQSAMGALDAYATERQERLQEPAPDLDGILASVEFDPERRGELLLAEVQARIKGARSKSGRLEQAAAEQVYGPENLQHGSPWLIAGYLAKRANHAMRPSSWSRRHFTLTRTDLHYWSKDQGEPVAIDLRLCLVRPAMPSLDRPWCFEVVSPLRTYCLQADSQPAADAWIMALQYAIEQAINQQAGSQENTTRTNSQDLSRLFTVEFPLSEAQRQEIKALPGNDCCFECQAVQPEWASITHGILLCIDCAGLHRAMGVHRSKVKSLQLDYWEAEQVAILLAIGNERARTKRQIELANLPGLIHRGDLMGVKQLAGEADAQALLYALGEGQFEIACLLLLWGVPVTGHVVEGDKFTFDPEMKGNNALHQFAMAPRLSVGVLLSVIRREGGQCLLLERNAVGLTPLDLALQREQPELATILRILMLRQEDKQAFDEEEEGEEEEDDEEEAEGDEGESEGDYEDRKTIAGYVNRVWKQPGKLISKHAKHFIRRVKGPD